MRIGIFSDAYNPAISGVVTSINMLEEGLRSLGHEVYIFTIKLDNYQTEDMYSFSNVIRFEGFSVPLKTLKSYKFSAALHKKVDIVEKYNLDVIHIQTEFTMGRLGILASKKLNIPVVYTFHTMYEDYFKYVSKFLDKHFKWVLYRILHRVLSPINKIAEVKIVPTKKVLNFQNIYKLTGDIRIIPTGIDLDKFDNSGITEEAIQLLREENNITSDEFVFLYLGRVSAEKSIDVLVKAFARICKNYSAKLLIVGDGPVLEDIKELARELNIQKYVSFTGLVGWDKVTCYYKLSDIFVNASVTETQGLTYIEALASHTPVLVQKDECLTGVVEDNYNGIYFDGVDDLVMKMKNILENQDTIKRLKGNARESVERFSKLTYAKNIQAVYLDVIEKNLKK